MASLSSFLPCSATGGSLCIAKAGWDKLKKWPAILMMDGKNRHMGARTWQDMERRKRTNIESFMGEENILSVCRGFYLISSFPSGDKGTSSLIIWSLGGIMESKLFSTIMKENARIRFIQPQPRLGAPVTSIFIHY